MILMKLFLVCLAIGLIAGNELKMRQDNWLLDKTNDSSVEISGSKLTVKHRSNGHKSGSLFNALYLGLVANGTKKRYYWEFTCVKNCKSVGLAKKDNYYSDNRTIEGVFYNQHLHDNHDVLIKKSIHDGIEDGDRIGFILETGEQLLKTYIVHNDRPLGLTFISMAPYDLELYPAVVLADAGTVEINEKKNINTDKLLVGRHNPEKGIRGDYKLVKMTLNGNVHDLQENCTLWLDKPKRGEIRFNMYIGNLLYVKAGAHPDLYTMRVSTHMDGRIVKLGKEDDLYMFTYKVKNGSSKSLGKGGKSREEDETIIRIMHWMERMKFSNDEVTIASGPNTTLLFKRFLF